MFYAKLKSDGTLDKYPYTLTDLRRDNPNTSFSQHIDDETAAAFGVVPVQPTVPPAETHDTNLSRSAQKQGDSWIEVWNVEPATAEQIAERTAAKSADLRNQRNALLAESDWTQMADVPLSELQKNNWASYRQALRDLTDQPGFPWSVTVPDKPE